MDIHTRFVMFTDSQKDLFTIEQSKCIKQFVAMYKTI